MRLLSPRAPISYGLNVMKLFSDVGSNMLSMFFFSTHPMLFVLFFDIHAHTFFFCINRVFASNVLKSNILTHTYPYTNVHKIQYPSISKNHNINIVKKWTESNFAYQAGVLELQAQCLVRGPAADDPATQEPIAALARQCETTGWQWRRQQWQRTNRTLSTSDGHQRFLGEPG